MDAHWSVSNGFTASARVPVLFRPHDGASRLFVFQMFPKLKQQRRYFVKDLMFETTSAADGWRQLYGGQTSLSAAGMMNHRPSPLFVFLFFFLCLGFKL